MHSRSGSGVIRCFPQVRPHLFSFIDTDKRGCDAMRCDAMRCDAMLGVRKGEVSRTRSSSCANGAMTDRLSQCKKLEHGLPGLNLCIRLKPFRTSHCGIASASLACPTGALAACPAHVVYGYWPRVILVSVSSTPRRHEHARAKLTRDRCARLDRSAIVGKGRGPATPAVPLQGIPRRKRRNALE